MADTPTSSRSRVIRDQIELLSLAEGFFQSSILFTLQRLGVFALLGKEGATLEELAARLNAPSGTLGRLLNAGVMLKLLVADGTHFRLSEVAERLLLPSAGDSYLGDWLALLDQFSGMYTRLDEAILSGGPVISESDYHGDDPQRTRQYIRAMHSYASLRGEDLAHYLDTSGCQSLLDLGCGPGTFAFHLGRRNPRLAITLADFPSVLETTREIHASFDLENEITYLPLDLNRDAIPGQYDLILASNVLQCFEEETRRDIMDRLHQALRPGGSVVIQAQHLNENRQGGRWAVFVDLNLLCTTRHGQNHTLADTRRWLEDAGFVNLESCSMSIYGTTSFVRGYRPQ